MRKLELTEGDNVRHLDSNLSAYNWAALPEQLLEDGLMSGAQIQMPKQCPCHPQPPSESISVSLNRRDPPNISG